MLETTVSLTPGNSSGAENKGEEKGEERKSARTRKNRKWPQRNMKGRNSRLGGKWEESHTTRCEPHLASSLNIWSGGLGTEGGPLTLLIVSSHCEFTWPGEHSFEKNHCKISTFIYCVVQRVDSLSSQEYPGPGEAGKCDLEIDCVDIFL